MSRLEVYKVECCYPETGAITGFRPILELWAIRFCPTDGITVNNFQIKVYLLSLRVSSFFNLIWFFLFV